jgi:hypothetical protein
VAKRGIFLTGNILSLLFKYKLNGGGIEDECFSGM